jgi:hypothetical protein
MAGCLVVDNDPLIASTECKINWLILQIRKEYDGCLKVDNDLVASIKFKINWLIRQ